ncbi:MAG: hypothetical protein ACPG4U_07820, partial [Pseudomonadales bacterium]
TLSEKLLAGVADKEGMGRHFGAGLYQAEVDYLVQCEWAYSVDDIIWRRSKLGLFMSAEEVAALDDYLGGRHEQPQPQQDQPNLVA